MEGKKMLEILFQSTLKIESSKSISELHTDDQKSKYSSNPEDLFKSDKKRKIYKTKTIYKATTTKFLGKIPTKKKAFNQLINSLNYLGRKFLKLRP